MKRERKKSGARVVLAAFLTLLVLGGTFCAGWYFGVNSTRYKGTILLVNDDNMLSEDYVPEGLVNLYEQRHSFRLASSDIYLTREAYEAMERMFAAAEADDVNGFIVTSGYRTFVRQKEIYEESDPGYAQAPGASEH
jgi:D-alanyl-D-alanine carboxypeptidase